MLCMDNQNDESNIVDGIRQVIEGDSRAEKIEEGESMTFDINLIKLRDKPRISIAAPIGLGTDLTDYIVDHVEHKVDKRSASDSGKTIGEITIKGDGEIKADIEEKHLKTTE